jgi:peptidoglycan hydrolase-like protein with peptidoglycan-binding domain
MSDTETRTFDRTEDPALNDDSQPSVTSAQQVLDQASENAGVPAAEAGIPAPADAIDLHYRMAIADVDAVEVGQTVAAAAKAGTPAEEIDVEAMGEGEESGTGPYEGRTVAQLRALAASKGLPQSGTKDELIAALRG